MSEFENCTNRGEKNCCGTLIKAFVDHVEGFSVELTYLDKHTETVHPWVITEVSDEGNKWIVMRRNSKEYEAIDSTKLTQKSRIVYARHHHWGNATFFKNKNCPI